MHDLINFACEELEELERKAKDKKMSMSDVQYADMLAHMKKNLLAAEGMMGSSRRSYENSYNSYARMGRDGDGDGRYSEDNFRYSPNRGGSYNYSGMNSRHSMVDTLEQMAQAAVDEHERRVLMDCMIKLK
jgi:hypothetical protein